MTIKKRTLKYLNKDFDGFKKDLLDYAKAHFGDKIKDFSEPSIAGMFLDMASYIGDVLSFYMDHQYNELFIDSAKETKNIQKIMNQFGYKAIAPTPATVLGEFSIEVPASITNSSSPRADYLLLIKKGTTTSADTGISFELQDDLDFADYTDIEGGDVGVDGNNLSYIIKKTGYCVSGNVTKSSHTFGAFSQFPTITLADKDVTEIISVTDSEGNEYYEVGNLSEDTVFEAVKNIGDDSDLVESELRLKHVPFRFTSKYDIETRLTTLQFGSGKSGIPDNDVVPDPSQYAIPMYGKTTLLRFSINPGQFLNTKTMGIAPYNTTVVVRYRTGGGLSHNVSVGSITSIDKLLYQFPPSNDTTYRSEVVSSISVTNISSATGGENRQTLTDIKRNFGGYYAAQERIVTKEDFLARIYSMPSKFGRIYKARVVPSRIPFTTELRVLSRNQSQQLIQAPDTLKKNLKLFISEYGMLNEKVEIFDSKIINIAVNFNIVVQSGFNKEAVLNTCLARLYDYFNISNFQIGQGILLSDVRDVIYNVDGVISVYDLVFKNMVGTIGNNTYYGENYEMDIEKNILICPSDAIFEVRYPESDIVGRV